MPPRREPAFNAKRAAKNVTPPIIKDWSLHERKRPVFTTVDLNGFGENESSKVETQLYPETITPINPSPWQPRNVLQNRPLEFTSPLACAWIGKPDLLQNANLKNIPNCYITDKIRVRQFNTLPLNYFDATNMLMGENENRQAEIMYTMGQLAMGKTLFDDFFPPDHPYLNDLVSENFDDILNFMSRFDTTQLHHPNHAALCQIINGSVDGPDTTTPTLLNDIKNLFRSDTYYVEPVSYIREIFATLQDASNISSENPTIFAPIMREAKRKFQSLSRENELSMILNSISKQIVNVFSDQNVQGDINEVTSGFEQPFDHKSVWFRNPALYASACVTVETVPRREDTMNAFTSDQVQEGEIVENRAEAYVEFGDEDQDQDEDEDEDEDGITWADLFPGAPADTEPPSKNVYPKVKWNANRTYEERVRGSTRCVVKTERGTRCKNKVKNGNICALHASHYYGVAVQISAPVTQSVRNIWPNAPDQLGLVAKRVLQKGERIPMDGYLMSRNMMEKIYTGDEIPIYGEIYKERRGNGGAAIDAPYKDQGLGRFVNSVYQVNEGRVNKRGDKRGIRRKRANVQSVYVPNGIEMAGRKYFFYYEVTQKINIGDELVADYSEVLPA